MGRAPCCEKAGVKRGPWSVQDDRILMNYILLHGHPNWRALPKQAGLKRCGKSCRLRWINYLRPDIKRGNFTREEEDAIINLHQTLGNKWSAIAARLPGRTDNEIKNVWHTHLKKRLKQDNNVNETCTSAGCPDHSKEPSSVSEASTATKSSSEDSTWELDISSFPEIDESFLLKVLSDDIDNSPDSDFAPFACFPPVVNDVAGHSAASTTDADFWYNLYTRAGDSLDDLPEF